MQAYLKKHGPDFAFHAVKVEWEILHNEVTIHFTVSKRSKKAWLSDETKTSDWSKNWGLWNTDVVEAFLQLRESEADLKAPYLEVQVSPLNQPFALIITEPRKNFFAPKTLEFTHQVNLEEKNWKTTLKLKLPPELKGDQLYGGFFACLDHDPREFYAVEPNLEVAPDFHRPDLFLRLDHG